MPTLTFQQREILKAWPNWVTDLRRDGYRVATDSTREKLAIPWDPKAAYMYRKRRENGHDVVAYYKFTEKRAPEKFHQEVWT